MLSIIFHYSEWGKTQKFLSLLYKKRTHIDSPKTWEKSTSSNKLNEIHILNWSQVLPYKCRHPPYSSIYCLHKKKVLSSLSKTLQSEDKGILSVFICTDYNSYRVLLLVFVFTTCEYLYNLLAFYKLCDFKTTNPTQRNHNCFKT